MILSLPSPQKYLPWPGAVFPAPSAADARGESGPPPWDEDVWSPTEAIRDAIRAAFDADPRVSSSRLAIAVGSGMVALFGAVADEEAKRVALNLAGSVACTLPVRDGLRVV